MFTCRLLDTIVSHNGILHPVQFYPWCGAVFDRITLDQDIAGTDCCRPFFVTIEHERNRSRAAWMIEAGILDRIVTDDNFRSVEAVGPGGSIDEDDTTSDIEQDVERLVERRREVGRHNIATTARSVVRRWPLNRKQRHSLVTSDFAFCAGRLGPPFDLTVIDNASEVLKAEAWDIICRQKRDDNRIFRLT